MFCSPGHLWVLHNFSHSYPRQRGVSNQLSSSSNESNFISSGLLEPNTVHGQGVVEGGDRAAQVLQGWRLPGRTPGHTHTRPLMLGDGFCLGDGGGPHSPCADPGSAAQGRARTTAPQPPAQPRVCCHAAWQLSTAGRRREGNSSRLPSHSQCVPLGFSSPSWGLRGGHAWEPASCSAARRYCPVLCAGTFTFWKRGGWGKRSRLCNVRELGMHTTAPWLYPFLLIFAMLCFKCTRPNLESAGEGRALLSSHLPAISTAVFSLWY